jgi:hypothetical protein
MSCRRCGAGEDKLWDDNLWWGCSVCGYAEGPDGPTFFFAKDQPGLARSVDEMKARGQLPQRSTPGFTYLVKVDDDPDQPREDPYE